MVAATYPAPLSLMAGSYAHVLGAACAQLAGANVGNKGLIFQILGILDLMLIAASYCSGADIEATIVAIPTT